EQPHDRLVGDQQESGEVDGADVCERGQRASPSRSGVVEKSMRCRAELPSSRSWTFSNRSASSTGFGTYGLPCSRRNRASSSFSVSPVRNTTRRARLGSKRSTR